MPGIANTPKDGRITSLPSFSAPILGTEMMYMVSPGNEQLGVSYNVLLNTLSQFFAVGQFLNKTVVTAGPTYNVRTADNNILLNSGAAISVVFPLSATMIYPFPVLVKNLSGADAFTITFSGGELCDGLNSIPVLNPYGWTTINPRPDKTGWYQTS